MQWEDVDDYTAMLGGVLFKNVENPIAINGKRLITLSRCRTSQMLGVWECQHFCV
jgi:hypothetical protein